VSLTFSVIEAKAKSGQGTYLGVASSYLHGLQPGDKVHAAIRPSNSGFHLPMHSEQVPLILVCAGAGLAPFRGFIQERAAMIAAGRKLAPAVLYHGCREPGKDDLFAEELQAWEKTGAVAVRRAYSRVPKQSGGNSYVQDVLWADRARLRRMWDNNAKLYICGSRQLGEGVQEVILRMIEEWAKEKGAGMDSKEVKEWWLGQRNVRYATDVFD
jgi:cytochrome P450 / NADPH-cytochrome P450 reductase